jgi:hypothetical protein
MENPIPNNKPFKKGQSGNPNGRPKGSRNRSTLVREWLEVSQKIKNPITGELEQLQQQDIMTLALIKKAREGDVQAYRELMDSAHGKTINQIDITTKGENINKPDLTKLSDAELRKLAELQRKSGISKA